MGEPSGGESFSWRSVAVGGYGPNLLYGVAEGAFIPVAVLAARDLGASVVVASATIAVFGAGSLLGNIPAGRLVSRVGERTALIIAGVLGVVGALVCRGGWSVAAYLVGVAVLGVAGSIFKLARQSYLAAVVPPHRRGLAMSTLGGVYRIGMFIGPLLGGVVIATAGLRASFLLVAAALVVAGALGLFVRPVAAEKGPGRRVSTAELVVEHRRVFGTVGIAVMVIGTLRASRNVALPLWADQLGIAPAQTAFVFAASALADVVLFLPAGLATDRFGRRVVAVPAMVLMGGCLVVLPWCDGIASLGAVAVAMGVGNGFTSGIIMTLGTDLAPPASRAEFFGIWRFIADVGSLGGPALISGIAAVSTLGPALVVVGVTGFVGAAVLQVSLRPPRT